MSEISLANVQANRTRSLAPLGLRQLVSVHQVHSDRILVVEERHTREELGGYDALISTLPDTGLLIQQADCQAVLLCGAAGRGYCRYSLRLAGQRP